MRMLPPLLLAIAVVWNPVLPFGFRGPYWFGAQYLAILVFVLVAAPVALLSFVDLSARRPRSWPLAMTAIAGLALMIAGALEFPTAADERVLTVLGGLLLAGAHLANWRRRHHDAHCAACE